MVANYPSQEGGSTRMGWTGNQNTRVASIERNNILTYIVEVARPVLIVHPDGNDFGWPIGQGRNHAVIADDLAGRPFGSRIPTINGRASVILSNDSRRPINRWAIASMDKDA